MDLIASPKTSLPALQSSLTSVAEMVDRVLAYVQSVLAGEIEGDASLGQLLLNTLNQSTRGLELDGAAAGGVGGGSGAGVGGGGTFVQDMLMMSYLSNLIRSQVEVGARLAMIS